MNELEYSSVPTLRLFFGKWPTGRGGGSMLSEERTVTYKCRTSQDMKANTNKYQQKFPSSLFEGVTDGVESILVGFKPGRQ